MPVKKKCTNLDCKDYDIEYIVQTSAQIPSSLYCPTCYFGKLDIYIEGNSPDSFNTRQDELIAAEFDIRKIIQR